jgi:hypothetical protein
MIRTKTVTNRRELRFNSFDDMVADAERLVRSPNTRMLGNWPLSQLLGHVTLAINGSIDGIHVKAPWFIRMLGPLIKRRVLKKMSPGFNLPKSAEAQFFPESSSSELALQNLQAAVARLQNERMTACHPVLGRLTHDEWTLLHLRHCELHFSFALPDKIDA